jgi:hypothetical protein
VEALKGLRAPHVMRTPAAGRIFLSFGSEDSRLADLITRELARRGLPVWSWQALSAGTNWVLQLERALASAELMIALISPSSEKSETAQREWAYFRALNKPIISVFVARTRIPLVLADQMAIDASADFEGAIPDLLRVVDKVLRPETRLARSADADARTPEEARMAQHIRNYLNAHSFTAVSFERVRENINPAYSDQAMLSLIEKSPEEFRRVRLKGNRPGIGLISSAGSAAKKGFTVKR